MTACTWTDWKHHNLNCNESRALKSCSPLKGLCIPDVSRQLIGGKSIVGKWSGASHCNKLTLEVIYLAVLPSFWINRCRQDVFSIRFIILVDCICLVNTQEYQHESLWKLYCKIILPIKLLKDKVNVFPTKFGSCLQLCHYHLLSIQIPAAVRAPLFSLCNASGYYSVYNSTLLFLGDLNIHKLETLLLLLKTN